MKKEDELEDLFKKKFENFEADVSPSVWKNVQTALKGFGLGILVKALLNKIGTNTIIAVVSSAATVVSTVLVMNWSGDKKTETVENKPTSTQAIVETTVPNVTDNVLVAKEEVKPEVASTKVEKEKIGNEQTNKTSINKKEIAKLISTLSEERAATINASPVSGTVPLIVSLMNSGTGKTNKWTYGDSKTVETETSPVHIYNEPGVYTVKLTSTNSEGKTTVDSVKIEVLGNSSVSSVPASFSRKALPLYLCKLENIKSTNAIIVDKKGNTIYRSEDTDTKWDGNWDGKNLVGEDAKEGTYYFIINSEGLDGKKYERKGSFILTK